MCPAGTCAVPPCARLGRCEASAWARPESPWLLRGESAARCGVRSVQQAGLPASADPPVPRQRFVLRPDFSTDPEGVVGVSGFSVFHLLERSDDF